MGTRISPIVSCSILNVMAWLAPGISVVHRPPVSECRLRAYCTEECPCGSGNGGQIAERLDRLVGDAQQGTMTFSRAVAERMNC